jgi:phosphoribosylanthranilate isomerase
VKTVRTSTARVPWAGASALPPGPVVKICGLTRLEDVIAARDLGVWALGFVFAPSPRRLEPGAVRGLLEGAGLGRSGPLAQGTAEGGPIGGAAGESRGVHARDTAPLTVGVFTDADAGEVARVAAEVGLDAVQLHGLAGPSTAEVLAALGGRDRGVLVIKALPVDKDESDPAALRHAIAQVRAEADVVLLDTRVPASAGSGSAGPGGRAGASAQAAPGFGGTGMVFRWRLAREAAPEGEGPLLVAGGIGPDNAVAALAESGAWGVDVSSGVESFPGIKDAALMERLVARVKEGTEK